MTTSLPYSALDAYEALAPGYDTLTRNGSYEQWLAALERLGRKHGLRGNQVLDVACGTGESFLPLLARGYKVTGCDISPRMLSHAETKAPSVPLHQADMRSLPVYGAFDLVMCVDDGLNYMLEEPDLRSCLAGFARNLGPNGRAIWDMNTLFQYRSQFAQDRVRDGGEVYLGWMGQAANREVVPGSIVEVLVDLFERRDDHAWARRTSVHRQRHWPTEVVKKLAKSAGLTIVEVVGQLRGARLGGEPDEHLHSKIVYVACHQEKGRHDRRSVNNQGPGPGQRTRP